MESPEHLWSRMSYRSWLGWIRYSNHEPWGELREDMRMATVVSNLLAAFTKTHGQTPDLIYPYITTNEDMSDEMHRILDFVKRNQLAAQTQDKATDHAAESPT